MPPAARQIEHVALLWRQIEGRLRRAANQSYKCILYGMDFMGDEYRARFGDDRPKPHVSRIVVEPLKAAPAKLPPRDVWLRAVVGMADYGPRNDAWCAA